MTSPAGMIDALNAALVAAEAEYRQAVTELAELEADNAGVLPRALADVDRIHVARTRIIALHAALEELAKMAEED